MIKGIKGGIYNNNYNYMINDEREKKDKEKITIKFLLTKNNYNYMIKEKKTIKKKSQLNFYVLIIIIII